MPDTPRSARRRRPRHALLAAASVALVATAALAGPAVAAVAVDAGADATLAEGSALARSVAIVDDVDDGAPGWSYSIDFGDGSAPAAGTTLAPSIPLSHVYPNGPAARTLAVTVNDAPGETAADAALVSVLNVAPVATATGPATTPEGAPYPLVLSAIDPGGPADLVGFSVGWGDGLSTLSLVPPGLTPHVYRDDEDGPVDATVRTINVAVFDDVDLGRQLLVTTVVNVAPTVALTGAATTAPGAAYVLALGPKVDPGTDTATATTVDWGDGIVEPASPSTTVSHVYATSGARTIVVRVTDEDGTFVAGTRAVSVAVPAPTAPSGLTAAATSRSSIRLAWSNTSAAQTAVLVERCKGLGCTRFSTVATLAGSATAYRSTGLAPNTSYSYRLRARNAAGTSTPSVVVTARTFR